METKAPINVKSVKAKISGTLNKTQQELEELALQFSLGKADAGDKFEEIKKEFRSKVQEWKIQFQSENSPVREKAHQLVSMLEELQVQLNLGKAEVREYFEKQKKVILKALDELETELKTHSTWNEFLSEFKSEGEKLRLKMEILQLKFELKKFKVSDDFKSAMRDVKKEAEKVLEKAEQKWDKNKSKFTDFNDEMSLVYKHMKKAIKSL